MTRLSPSDPTLESRALALLDEALEQPSPERLTWAEARTADDPALRARVLALLGAAGRRGEALGTGGASTDTVEVDPPERIGAYRIGERLGQGGMGAVYRAERDAGDFKHTVAIKIIRPGALSEALVERFARERQTLADLAHPNIARLFDGGETPDGQPFIVMEYVDGQPITTWAKAQALDAGGRLRLFLSACEAVRFAHQNLIIHRDLTPSNVLVTGEGVVKLIDFGIARPPEVRTTESPSQASLAGLSLTPGFAAPERLAGAATSTLVDVYSLGRLLDRLLEGLPLDPDLQAVTARAVADAPEARYPSVDALIADVQAFLAGRTVAARGGGRRYATGKFIRRHRRAVAASAAGLTMLVGALVVTLVAYGTATRAQAAEARRFGELRSLASYMLFDLEDRLTRVAGNTQARAGLADQAQRYLAALSTTARADDDLRLEAARGFIRLAHAQGVPGQPNLGRFEPARANLRTALQLLGGDAAPPAVAADAVNALVGLSMIEMNTDSDVPAASARLKQAEAMLDATPVAVRDDAWRRSRASMRRAQLDLAVLSERSQDLPALTDRLDREVDAWPELQRRSLDAELARAYADQARAIYGYLVDDFPPGIAAAQRAERRLLALDAARPNDPDVLYALAWTAYAGFGAASGEPETLREMDRFIEVSKRSIERLLALEENDDSLRGFYSQTAQAQSQSLSYAGRHSEAVAAQREVLARFEAALIPERRPARLNRLAIAYNTMAGIARRASDRALVCDSYRRAITLRSELQRRGELLGSTASRLASADAVNAACARGVPFSSLPDAG